VAIHRGYDSRRLVPLAIVNALSALIEDDLPLPSYRRVALREIRSALCRVYKLDDPQLAANASDIAQSMEEIDGIPQED